MNKEHIEKKDLQEEIKREVAIMKLLKHPQIVKLFEVLEGPDNIYIIMELVTGKR